MKHVLGTNSDPSPSLSLSLCISVTFFFTFIYILLTCPRYLFLYMMDLLVFSSSLFTFFVSTFHLYRDDLYLALFTTDS